MGRNVFVFKIGGVEVPMIIDSGADVNIINREIWNQMKEAGVKVENMSTTIDRNLMAYASAQPMDISGMFMAEIEAGRKDFAKFYVVENGQQCLLGDQTAKNLKVLKVGFNVGAVKDQKLEPFPKSPMVPVTKDSGEIRLCIDMRQANRAVLRETHPFPLVDELLSSMNRAVRFSKIDIKDAYHQVEISETSKPITTFITKHGLFRYQRLMFGVSCAPELFQKVMESVVAGLDGVIVYLDDVVVHGKTQQEHTERLMAVLQRLDEYGVLLNDKKCVYNVRSLEFLGHILSVDGIHPTESRVDLIQRLREPRNVSELRSFLGLVCYVGRFIPDLASRTDSLRKLLRLGVRFQWTEKERNDFEAIKTAICNIDYLGFFNPKDRTKLIADASPTGLGAVLLQEDANERWVLRLQAYNYDIEHIPGSANIADALSRLTVNSPEQFDEGGQIYVRNVAEQAVPVALTFQEITNETRNDETIQAVVKALDLALKEEFPKVYRPFETELCSVDGILLRGNRLVIPVSLRDRVIELAHEAHPGFATMKRRLRQKVWWPLMDKAVENCVKRCKQCTLVSSLGVPEPLQRTKMPVKPWIDIAVDFMGPLPSGHNLLVIVDYFSSFIEVIVMKQITAKHTVQALHESFCRFGVPETMKADNGPQFISEELTMYCREYGIQLRRTNPYWPQTNGEVERANKTILKHLKISQESGSVDWIWDLRTFLLMYNSTPHATTGAARSVLMFGRALRDKLPSVDHRRVPMDEEGIQDRDWTNKLKDAEYCNARRHTKPTELREGDIVVSKRMCKTNKLSTTFAPEEFQITKLTGSDATLSSTDSNRIIHRNVAHLKPLMKNTASEEADARRPENGDGATSQEFQGNELSGSSLPKDPNQRPSRSLRVPVYLKDYHTV
ncbi:uncharacterized protein K02A2.6-like [Toxorhynchites rutilus septentrionalis]|uniref:uncharacterized protein K02A2.6-like n=1 Tax=Toxorhynchites rutilus septentrionalis TaxID=329112 RepID=UPI002479D06D|nr:uncharacterized protein K02A2.6-like [Toxorhynchites rutilus septentrionalis]